MSCRRSLGHADAIALIGIANPPPGGRAQPPRREKLRELLREFPGER
jgi:hypothetical protein